MPDDNKEKPPSVLPNDPAEIIKIYQENRVRAQIQVSEGTLSSSLAAYFKPFNMIKRILLYRDVVNKSQRRGMITLHSFYINTPQDDQQLYMFYQKPGTEVKDGVTLKLNSNEMAAKEIKAYEEVEAQKQKDRDLKMQDKFMKKDD